MRLFEHADEQFEFCQAADPAVVGDTLDQPAGVVIVDIAARLCGIDDELDQSLDEEVAPFGGGLVDLVVEDKDRFGLFRIDLAVGPGRAAQREDFVCGNGTVFSGLRGECAEVQGHRFNILGRSCRDDLRDSA